MIDAPLALGFAAGMVAAFNPCGFALVPAYLSFFLGLDADAEAGAEADAADPPRRRAALAPLIRALVVGGAVTVGFLVVFGLTGIVAGSFAGTISRAAPWISIPIGLVLSGLGVLTLLGRRIPINLPRLAVGGRTRGVGSMAAYGVSYATVSLSCTLPVFLAVGATTFDDASLLSGLATFAAYSLGMGTVLTGLAVSMTLARRPLGRILKQAGPAMARLGGGLLVLAGAYVTWYAVYELRIQSDDEAALGPVGLVTDLSGTVSNWVNNTGPLRIALVLLILAVVGAAIWLWQERRRSTDSGSREPSAVH
ncbi:MAG: cytochrome c biogenesis protein CcdA [Acidimicrobiales bacterium]